MHRCLKTSKRICLNNRDFHKEILLTMAPHGRRTIPFHGTKIKHFTRTDDHGSRKYTQNTLYHPRPGALVLRSYIIQGSFTT